MNFSPYREILWPVSPLTIRLFWRGWFASLGPKYYPDSLSDRALLQQFWAEIDCGHAASVSPAEYERILQVASRHGYWLETYGGPEDDALLLEHRRKVLAEHATRDPAYG